MKTFENKTVVITGGTSGIGKAAALAFAREGANVVVSGRRVAEGEKVAGELASAGPGKGDKAIERSVHRASRSRRA